MARDDYYVIAYQILAYLYTQLKKGEDVNPEVLKHDSNILKINRRYWMYVMNMLFEEGYIDGLLLVPEFGEQFPCPEGLQNCYITPRGIEYLVENSMFRKVRDFIKEAGDIISPFRF